MLSFTGQLIIAAVVIGIPLWMWWDRWFYARNGGGLTLGIRNTGQFYLFVWLSVILAGWPWYLIFLDSFLDVFVGPSCKKFQEFLFILIIICMNCYAFLPHRIFGEGLFPIYKIGGIWPKEFLGILVAVIFYIGVAFVFSFLFRLRWFKNSKTNSQGGTAWN